MIKPVSYTVYTDKEFEGEELCFILLSDLHGCTYGKDNAVLCELLKGFRSKTILFAGDMINDSSVKSINNALKLVNTLYDSGYVIYYTQGNHEKRTEISAPALYREFLDRISEKCILLDNRSVSYKGITISGYDPENIYYKKVFSAEDVCSKIRGFDGPALADASRFHLLISHDPDYFKAYVMAGYDLTVSGHIHGGTVRLPFLGGLLSPRITFFPKYDRGVFNDGSSSMVVSAGAGHHGLPPRMFNPTEIVEITIRKGKTDFLG